MPTNDQVGRRPPPGASRRVTVVPPIFGPTPTPPASIISALDLLYTLHSEARDPRDTAAQGGFDAFRFVVAALFDETYRPRAHGLSARATRTWLDRVWAVLPEEDLVALRQYTDTCHAWHTALRAVVTDDAADPDWDMTSAQGVWPNPAEQCLAAALAAAGIPVQAQVGVSKYGGHRRGGWFAGYWLDCAHRDVRYGLRIDVELDGRAHLSGDRPLRDAKRNMLLQLRGWYVVRLPGSLLHTAGFDRAVAEIAALAVQHRRAVVLARSDVGQILQDLAAAAPPATPSRPSETVSPAAPVIPAAVAPRPAAQADLMAQRPLCPRCGHPLVRRMARQGPHAGQPFYGCAGYPQCRYTQSISSSATPGP